jgi:hypothetical protein
VAKSLVARVDEYWKLAAIRHKPKSFFQNPIRVQRVGFFVVPIRLSKHLNVLEADAVER